MGMKAPVGWSVKAGDDRPDWDEVKSRVDLVQVATNLMGPAPGRRGERSRRNRWWTCPFHQDKNPSLCIQVGASRWKCYGCPERGDAANLVMKLRNVGFRDAVEWLAEFSGVVSSSASRPSGPAAKVQNPILLRSSAAAPSMIAPAKNPPSSSLSSDQAAALVEEASRLLWEPAGAVALKYLQDRGLEDETIRRAKLGWGSRIVLPKRSGEGTWSLSGIVVPWFDRDRLALVKIRRLGLFEGPKYIEVFRDRPLIYPGPSSVRPGGTLIVCEGEFDTLLLGQELVRLNVDVVTLGSASSNPAPIAVDLLCTASRLFIATDGDEAGDQSASRWPAHARRVRPPAPDKDWTEVHAGGFNRIRYLWPGILCSYNWPRADRIFRVASNGEITC
jgi:DNA primase